jgi:hypothetical protein
VIALTLLASLVMQDTNTALSPRVRAMLERFPLPRAGEPSVAIRFSRDSVWVGEQVELVTAAWFPRRVRDRLRRQPTIKVPSLSGLWSARNQMLPIPAEARLVGGQMYDLFVSYQTIFPLGPGRIDAPPAVLTYDVPTSTSYFAPEERKTIVSPSARLVARGIPPALAAALGTGPTAHDLRLAWRGPVDGLRIGSPAIVELAISGAGNLTLWPAPQIRWPSGVHVYPEPTDEHAVPVQGVIAGEKRFRFTVVADSAGVLTLPAVTYPFFDPLTGTVHPATAGSMSLPVRPRTVALGDRKAPMIVAGEGVPPSTEVIRVAWPILIALALFPPLLAGWRHRRLDRRVITVAPESADPESALRTALGTPVAAGPDHVVAALRVRGVSREDAEHILRWLIATGRRRYGPSHAPAPEPPSAVARVLKRLRRVATALLLLLIAAPLHSGQDDAVSRYDGRDYAGAARAFEGVVEREPAAADAWLGLGDSRWMQGDDVAAAAAWLRALELAPRNARLRAAWREATTIPSDVRALAPVVPASLDDLLLIALALWVVGWGAVLVGWPRVSWPCGALVAVTLLLAVGRVRAVSHGRALVTVNAVLRVSPHPAMESIGEVPAWSLVHVDRRHQNWALITAQQSAPSSAVGSVLLQGWIPAEALVEINPVGRRVRQSTEDVH